MPSQPSTPAPHPRDAFYAAALVGLRALEAREGRPRRFGPDADAQWARFHGALHTGDRLDILLRDAAATWGVAFSGARAFRLPGVAADEAFGPSWPTPDPDRAAALLGSRPEPSLAVAAAALGVKATPVILPTIRPDTRLVLAGGAAILAVASAFMGRADLDWSIQVTVVAESPAHRQLAGLAALFVGAIRPGPLLAPSEGELPEGAVRIVSPDADPGSAARLGA